MTLSSKAISGKIVKAIGLAPLSDTSKAQYLRKLEILAERGGHADLWTAVKSHDASIMALMQKYGSKHASMHMFASAVLSAFKHVPSLKTLAHESYTAWLAVHEGAQRPLELHALTAKPTERQALGWVPFEEIVKKREALAIGSDARLLISMYTLVPSLRNDLGILKIFPDPPPADTPGNHLVLPDPPSKLPAILTIAEFKTSKRYDSIAEELPETLVSEIRASLARRPLAARGYLFVSVRDGLPFKTEKSFSNWANALLNRTFRKPLTLTLLRHAFITALKFDEMTPLQRMDVARRMGHSVETQMKYKFIF